MTADKARLILRGLGGSHLSGFLPGGNHKAARSQASMHGWMVDGRWGAVTCDGIGEWDHGYGPHDRKRSTAAVFVTWDEVVAVVARGCGNGRREAYEAAQAAFFDWAELTEWRPGETRRERAEREAGLDPGLYGRVHERLRAAEAAIIEAGCAAELVQDQLF